MFAKPFVQAQNKENNQSSTSLPLVRVDSPHKAPVTRKMVPFDDVIMCGADAPHWKNWKSNYDTWCSKAWSPTIQNLLICCWLKAKFRQGHFTECDRKFANFCLWTATLTWYNNMWYSYGRSARSRQEIENVQSLFCSKSQTRNSQYFACLVNAMSKCCSGRKRNYGEWRPFVISKPCLSRSNINGHYRLRCVY